LDELRRYRKASCEKSSRGGKTAIELLLAGLREWDKGLWAIVDDETSTID
jgi:hypothetical protein